MEEFDQLNKLSENIESEPVTSETETIVDYSKADNYDNDRETRMTQLMDRLRLKNKILQYQEKFTDELKVYDYKMQQLDNLSNPDLEVFLDEIKIAVRMRNSANMTKSLYFGGLNFAEKVACGLGYDITGFHNVLYQQKEIHKCLDEMSLEFEDRLDMPAPIRLTYLTLQVAMSVHSHRATEKIIKVGLEKKLDSKTVNEYKDL